MVTTRTSSPYFSPNSATAPVLRACSMDITSARTSMSCSRTSLTSSSTSASTLGGHRAGGRGEVEAQPAGRVERTGLRGHAAHGLADARVHQVRRGVRTGDRAAPGHLDLRVRRRVEQDLAADHLGAVHGQTRHGRLHVVDVQARGVGDDAAVVGLLATALGVERGAVEHDLDLGALARSRHADAVDVKPTRRFTITVQSCFAAHCFTSLVMLSKANPVRAETLPSRPRAGHARSLDEPLRRLPARPLLDSPRPGEPKEGDPPSCARSRRTTSATPTRQRRTERHGASARVSCRFS